MKKATLQRIGTLVLSLLLLVAYYGVSAWLERTDNAYGGDSSYTDASGQSGTDTDGLDPLSVHYMDVGQGDATILICGEEAMLIDAGIESSGSLLWSYLDEQGVTRLTYAVGTHPDSDHIGGLDAVLDHVPTETVFMPHLERDTATYRDVIDTIERERCTLIHPAPGEVYTLGDASFTILGPIDETAAESNNHSICMVVEHGENRFLFTGDAEQVAEENVIDAGYDLSADVYQMGHHGSSSSSCQEFLDAVSPTWAVISCGLGNRYGHPHWETLSKLEEADIQLFRTDLQGTVVAVSDGETITWSTEPTDDWRRGFDLKE